MPRPAGTPRLQYYRAALVNRATAFKPVFRLHERIIAARAREPTDPAPDGLPLPPARLRVLVDGHGDPEGFLSDSAATANAIRRALAQAGVEPGGLGSVLDFGCGCGRTARHWPDMGWDLHGCDYNPELVAWCREALPFMEVRANKLEPPTAFPAERFDLVYAISILTHLSERLAQRWVTEWARVLKPGALLLVTTHGDFYRSSLNQKKRQRYDAGEIVVSKARLEGLNACAAHHPPASCDRAPAGGVRAGPASPRGEPAGLPAGRLPRPRTLRSVEITSRQSLILRRVVEAHVETESPVASKWLADQTDIPWGPSTVRAELARLEEAGLLEHPHTSAGRVPTDVGYRRYVDSLLDDGELPIAHPRFELGGLRREVDEAMRATTEQLSQVTNLLALVSAPPLGTTTIRRVEVLLLQPQVLMVVVITSTGGVTKRVISYDKPLDPGLVDWAGSYLNEALGGLGVGARGLRAKLASPELHETERAFLATLGTAFEVLDDELYVEGTGRLFSEHRFKELPQLAGLMSVLEERVQLLHVLQESLTEPNVYLHIGRENPAPELHSLSLVGANYGVARRNLGAVSVIGPVRMDYPTAITAVRQAARELSHFVSELYDE